MNWTAGTELSCLNQQYDMIKGAYNNKAVKKTESFLKKLIEEDIGTMPGEQDPIRVFSKFTDGYYIADLGIKYANNHPELFERYLDPFYKFAVEYGLKRDDNSIIPLVSDFQNDVIENLNDVSYERFVEWKLT